MVLHGESRRCVPSSAPSLLPAGGVPVGKFYFFPLFFNPSRYQWKFPAGFATVETKRHTGRFYWAWTRRIFRTSTWRKNTPDWLSLFLGFHGLDLRDGQ